MDGTRADRRVGGLLDRPATLTVIARDYPDIIIGLIHDQCIASSVTATNGSSNIRISLPSRFPHLYEMHEGDFKICQQLAISFSQNPIGPGRASVFKSEPVEELRQRIAAHLMVLFSGRNK